MTTVSIFTVSHNSAETIRDTIESVRRQVQPLPLALTSLDWKSPASKAPACTIVGGIAARQVWDGGDRSRAASGLCRQSEKGQSAFPFDDLLDQKTLMSTSLAPFCESVGK